MPPPPSETLSVRTRAPPPPNCRSSRPAWPALPPSGWHWSKRAISHGGTKAYLIAIGVVSVALAWSAVHTVYSLLYARLYYSPPVGGIDFNEPDAPTYLDFAYLALTIGMTFQVSDTNLTTKRVRRSALHHALLSYLFGAVIIALLINVVSSLLH